MASNISVEQFLLEQTSLLAAHDSLRSVFAGITKACSLIEAKIRSAGLSGIYGAAGAENVQGEEQQKLDVFANDTLSACLGEVESVAALVSEEDEAPVTFERAPGVGKYIVIFDPLDGSSNIDVNVNVGTIFGIHQLLAEGMLEESILQRGDAQLAAGYVVYGPSTVLVLTIGEGVNGFTLDPASGTFMLSHPAMKMPEKGPYYSVNEANASTWPGDGYVQYVNALRADGYSSRYIGSLVADFHRTMLKGGVFLYPPTKKQPGGKLRLLYEANPLALVAEQAGGLSSSGIGAILAITPTGIHQRTAFIVGSKDEMGKFIQSMEPRF
jgi:fructose-1,6-bisphosphatase I